MNNKISYVRRSIELRNVMFEKKKDIPFTLTQSHNILNRIRVVLKRVGIYRNHLNYLDLTTKTIH